MGIVGAASLISTLNLFDFGQGTNTTSAATKPDTASNSVSDADCVVACDGGCTFPGECGRYVDLNGNNLCDFSECQQVDTTSETESADVQPDADCAVLCDQNCSYPGECGRYVDTNGNNLCDLSECQSEVATSSQENASAATPQPTTTDNVSTDCVVACDQGCSYPGNCDRYIDVNGNHLCDLGECLATNQNVEIESGSGGQNDAVAVEDHHNFGKLPQDFIRDDPHFQTLLDQFDETK